MQSRSAERAGKNAENNDNNATGQTPAAPGLRAGIKRRMVSGKKERQGQQKPSQFNLYIEDLAKTDTKQKIKNR